LASTSVVACARALLCQAFWLAANPRAVVALPASVFAVAARSPSSLIVFSYPAHVAFSSLVFSSVAGVHAFAL